jgi:tetratricopeptide (TPR) repeat protein
MAKWNTYPHDNSDFLYSGNKLKSAWAQLHDGDCVEYPSVDWVANQLDEYPDASPEKFDGEVADLSDLLLDAWRGFHSGDFEKATKLADSCGILGHAVANKATGIYATYLQPSAKPQQALFLAAVERAEQAIELLPDDPNSHYFHAFNLGRYSQSISIAKALSQGIGGKIKTSLDAALDLQPKHAEAHTAMGLYHAEIISKVGKMLGKLTYGANSKDAIEHFKTALKLTPKSPIAHIEYANGLYLLYEDDRIDEVTELYVKATELQARDAMEQLDIVAALGELE